MSLRSERLIRPSLTSVFDYLSTHLTYLPWFFQGFSQGHISPMGGSSVVQLAEQPSPSVLFPSSHCSLPFMMVSPQAGNVHALVHPSSFTLLPSSHSSLPFTMLSPQAGNVHRLVQSSSSTLLPSSHSSGNACWSSERKPSPQTIPAYEFRVPDRGSVNPPPLGGG